MTNNKNSFYSNLKIIFDFVKLIAVFASLFMIWTQYMVSDLNILLVVKSLGLILFSITTVEFFIINNKSISYSLLWGLISFFLYAVLGLLHLSFLSYFFISVSLFFWLKISFEYSYNFEKKYFFILFYFITLCFSFFLLKSVFVGEIVPIFFKEDFLNGFIHIDALFHIDIINMITTYQVPSIGIDDIIYIKYHNLTHWLFAQWSFLLDCKAYQSYTYCSAIIIMPYFVLSYLLCVSQMQWVFYKVINTKYVVLISVVLLVGLIPLELSLHVKMGLVDMPLQSITMMLGGIFIFIFFSFFALTLKENKFFIFPYFFLALLGLLAKGTLLVCTSPILTIYFLFKKDKKNTALSLFLNGAVLLVYYILFHSSYSVNKINLFSYFSYSTEKGFYLYSFLLASFWIIITIYFLLKYKENEKYSNLTHKNIHLVILILIYEALTNYALVNIIDFDHNAGFFIQNSRWIGIMFATCFISYEIRSYFSENPIHLKFSSKNYLLFFILFYFSTNSVVTMSRYGFTLIQLTTNKKREYVATATTSLYEERKKLLVLLNKIEALDNKKELILVINNKEKLNKLFPTLNDKSITFLIPTLTGIAIKDGVDENYFKNNNAYFGYADYYGNSEKQTDKKIFFLDLEKMKIYK